MINNRTTMSLWTPKTAVVPRALAAHSRVIVVQRPLLVTRADPTYKAENDKSYQIQDVNTPTLPLQHDTCSHAPRSYT